MNGPRNADEQGFWDAAYVAYVSGIVSNPEVTSPKLGGCADQADAMLAERRKRAEAWSRQKQELVVGSSVRATRRITEGGGNGDTEATYPDPNYIHTEKGDLGTVETIDHGHPTVRFRRTGTATIVGYDEIELV